MKSFTQFIIALLFIAVATSGTAQQVTQKQTLTLAGAKKAIAAAVAKAKELNAPGGVIAVVDDGGNLMAVERLDGTFAAGALISIGKARTAAIFKRQTSVFEKIIREGRTPMVALISMTRNGRSSTLPRSTPDAQREDSALTGIASRARFRSASKILTQPARRWFSKPRWMITPRFGWTASCRARSDKRAVRS